MSPVSGQFEVIENGSVVVSGRISILTEPGMPDDGGPTAALDTGALPLNSDDVYRELRLRGYDYGPTFRGVLSTDGTGIGAITSKIKHAIKHKTSPARFAQLLQPSLAFCFSLQPMTAH